MKIRLGFVSNSSSSSFICDVCGRSEGGYDASLSDFEMLTCYSGHVFCADEVINIDNEYENDEQKFNNLQEYLEGYDNCEIPSIYCPICQMKHFKKDDFIKYIIKTYKDYNVIENEIREKFKDYNEFKTFLKAK